jgi:hypothetical protein
VGEQNGARNAAPGAQSGAKSDAQDVTSDGTRATASQQLPPSIKSSRFIRATATGPPQRRPGKTYSAPQRQATGREPPPAHGQPRGAVEDKSGHAG